VQILVDTIDFGMNIQEAGDMARIRHDGSATPTGEPAMAGGGIVAIESGISDEAAADLKARGHRVVRERGGGFGGYQAILVDWEHGTLQGATEPRKDGAAVGY
jgi:gamma-glutamyltranspeptidase/glutathione hydrolase